MAEKHELAANDYVSGMKYKDIAEKYGVSLDTVKSWKKRHWQHLNKGAPNTQKNEKRVHPKKSEGVPVEDARLDIEMVVEAFAEDTETNAELSDVQRQFCLEYTKYLNATKAYQKAYECTYETANANGPRLLVKASIRAEIARLKKVRAAGLMLDGQDVLQKYIDIAFADLGDYIEYGAEDEEILDFDGNIMLDKDGYPKTYKRSYVRFKHGADLDNTVVSEVVMGKMGISLKLHDKMKALDVLAKYTDLLDDRTKTNMQIEKEKVQLALKSKELEQLGKDEQNKDFTINFVRKG